MPSQLGAIVRRQLTAWLTAQLTAALANVRLGRTLPPRLLRFGPEPCDVDEMRLVLAEYADHFNPSPSAPALGQAPPLGPGKLVVLAPSGGLYYEIGSGTDP